MLSFRVFQARPGEESNGVFIVDVELFLVAQKLFKIRPEVQTLSTFQGLQQWYSPTSDSLP